MATLPPAAMLPAATSTDAAPVAPPSIATLRRVPNVAEEAELSSWGSDDAMLVAGAAGTASGAGVTAKRALEDVPPPPGTPAWRPARERERQRDSVESLEGQREAGGGGAGPPLSTR